MAQVGTKGVDRLPDPQWWLLAAIAPVGQAERADRENIDFRFRESVL